MAEIVKILDIVSRLRNAATFAQKMDLLAEGIGACGWTFVHLYVFDSETYAVKSAAYWGIDEAGRKYLENKRMTLAEIEAILRDKKYDKYKIGRCYYLAHEVEDELIARLRSTGWTAHKLDDEENSSAWHPYDMLYVPLIGFGGKFMGLVSVDSPHDGLRPTTESLKPVELFVDYAIAFVEEDDYKKYLSKTRAVFSEIFNLSPTAMIISDEQDSILSVNAAATQMLAYSFDELRGHDSALLFSPTTDFKKIVEARNQGAFKGEALLKQKNGNEIWAYITNTAIKNHAGEIEAHILMAVDITEIKKLHLLLLRAEKMSGIGILASGIANELNNPLYAIMGMAENIISESDVEHIYEYAHVIIENAKDAAAIVKDLAGYSHASRVETASTIDINAIAKNSVSMLQRMGKLARVHVELSLADLRTINANANEIQIVLLNLITNAIDAMPEGGVLTIVTRQCDFFAELKISDTGKGIPRSDLSEIFSPFFTTKPVGEGTGLGLFVAYRIVSKYKGTIDCDSVLGSGTTFTVRFLTAD